MQTTVINHSMLYMYECMNKMYEVNKNDFATHYANYSKMM